MKAHARIVAEADGRGGTRLVELYGEVPLLARRTGPGEVHLVGGAAGPLGGDELSIDLYVGPGARLVVATVAASIALPGNGISQTRISATVDGRLEWLPEPIVAAHRCDHVTQSTVELGPAGSLRWREEVVCGRHAEDPGDLVVRTTVRRAGRTLFRQDFAIGPRAPGWSGPAVLGGHRVAGTLIAVEPDWERTGPPPARAEPDWALLPLAGPGVVVSAVGDAHRTRTALTAAGARLADDLRPEPPR